MSRQPANMLFPLAGDPPRNVPGDDLGFMLITGAPARGSDGRILRRPRLAGLLNDYERAA
jgi:hypothetical protein